MPPSAKSWETKQPNYWLPASTGGESRTTRIAELGAPAAKRVRATAADLLEKTERVYDRAIEKDKLADANRAVELQGKLGGALIDRVEIGGVGEFAGMTTPEQVVGALLSDLDPPDLIELLHRMLELVEARASNMAKPIPPPDQPEARRGGRRSAADGPNPAGAAP